jgi:CHAT domain
MHEYCELKVRIEREADAFRVAAAGPSGEATGTFTVPFSQVELENLVLRVSRPRQTVRRIDSPEMELVRRFGNELFNSIFQARVRDVYRDSYAQARAEGKGLRITLALADAPDLMNLPWEYLYDEPAFLSISTWTPVVRYLNLPRARRPLPVSTPLRILAMVSAPSDSIALDVDREKRLLQEALGDLVASGGVEIHWLEQATLRALQRELRRDEYHIFHFIGHGGYDHAAEDGVLLLEAEDGRGRLVSGSQLGTMLADHTTLRLAVLNACEGARTSVEDPFAGVAASLVQREIPAVIAMQFEITDRAAIVFAHEFYAAVADGYPVDSAVAEARKAIFADANDIEWGTPVLFMRVPDGRIFDVAPSAPVVEAVEEPEPAELQPEPALVEPEPEPEPKAEPEPEPEPEPEAEPEPQSPAPGPSVAAVSLPAPSPPARRSRVLPLALTALGGAGLALLANAFTHIKGQETIGTLAAYVPETVGVPLVVAAVALLLGLGRIREQLGYGLLLGFGLLTVAAGLGMARIQPEFGLELGGAPFVFLAGGAVVLAAALFGVFDDSRSHSESNAATFRWGWASSLAIAGAAVLVPAIFLPLGYLEEDGSDVSLASYGRYGLSGSALEPAVAILAAAVAAYALGRRGTRTLLAAGVVLALGAQTALMLASWLGSITSEYYVKPDLRFGWFVGITAAALLVAAGLVGRRLPQG